MKIDSKDFKVKDIFSRRTFRIPDYQRDYAWVVDEEVSTFWDDFNYYLESKSKGNFFIGPMVFKGEDINSHQFEVIDGQQRLITLAIFVSVIIEFFQKHERQDLADGLKQYLLYKDEKNNEQLVIETVEPHPFFQKRIFHGEDVRPTKPSEKLIEQTRIFLFQKIETLLSEKKNNEDRIALLEEIRTCVFDIDTVVIVSSDETDAFTIFETINTRGRDLSSLDLLKNYLFKNFVPKAGIMEPKETWKEIKNNLGQHSGSFFNRFWASWIVKVSENKLYRRFADYIRDSNKNKEFPDAEFLLKQLLTASRIYKEITKPSIDSWKKDKLFHVYSHIRNIGDLFALKVHFSFFLALFEEFEKKNIDIALLNKTLLLMENFHFIFTHIVSSRPSGFDSKYSKFAIRLRRETNKNKVIEDLRKDLLGKLPTQDEYAEKFKVLNFLENKNTIKFILLRLQKDLDSDIASDFELHSLDHLAPKSAGTLGVHNIGNLILLEKSLNEEVKKDHKLFDTLPGSTDLVIDVLINKTKYLTTRDELIAIKKKGKWDRTEIDARRDELMKKTFNLFSDL